MACAAWGAGWIGGLDAGVNMSSAYPCAGAYVSAYTWSAGGDMARHADSSS